MKQTIMLVVLSSLVLAGCSSSPESTYDITKDELKAQELKTEVAEEKAAAVLASVPRWVIEPPRPDASGVYGVGVGESSKVHLAMKKSSLNAQFELAKSLGQELSGNEQSYVQDGLSNTTEQYTQVIDSLVAEIPVQGFEVVQQELVTLDGKFTSYQLLKLPYEQFNHALQSSQATSQKEEIQAAFSSLQERIAARRGEIGDTSPNSTTTPQ
ncbi:hypothetical protein G6Z92_06475 [Vibrio aestuarianus subsp. cardii]|uniref:hypothetical protein n=1 Tax=Vibrio aestuarianus TaxID=28171 RepID=UPI0015C5627C|nr:hypothetical protein [Vibrio aestuarianus]NGZ66631.1 hypothetical protein [Vibrio aestuarianus subsp. cardii]